MRDRQNVLIATEKSSHCDFNLSGAQPPAADMKKNKKNKSAAETNEVGTDVDIAPQALANLVDKLKVDLARHQDATPKIDNKKNKSSKSGNGKSGSSGPLDKQQRQVKEKHSQDPKEKKQNVSSAGPRQHQSPKVDRPVHKKEGKGRDQANRVNGAEKPSNRPKQSRSEPGKRSNNKSGKGNEKKATSLLDEILALGGSKDDLELIEDIDTDEDIIEGSDAPKSKGKDKKDKTVPNFLLNFSDSLAAARITGPTQISWINGTISRGDLRGGS